MQRHLSIFVAVLAGCATTTPSSEQAHPSRSEGAQAVPAAQAQLAYPATRKVDAKDVLHGVAVADPYRWLEDGKSPEVQTWITAQDRVARAQLQTMPGRDAIADRLRQLLYYDSITAPLHRGNRYFYTRRLASKEKAMVYVREGQSGPERVLLDPNAWTKDGSEGLGGFWPSWDGKRVAFKVRHNNSDETTTYVLDVDTLERSRDDVIDGTKYAGAAWTPQGDGFYYTWIPPEGSVSVADRPGEQVIKFHRIGIDPAKDRVVVDRIGDPTTFQSVDLAIDGHWLVRTVQHGWRSSEVFFRDGNKEGGPWTTLVAGKDAIYEVEAYRDRLYVTTNEGAPNKRVFAVDPAKPDRRDWQEIVPERKRATLEAADLIGGKLALVYLEDVLSRVEIHDLEGKLVREVSLPDLGTASGLAGRPDEDEAWFSFEAFTVPTTIYRTSIAKGGAAVYFRLDIPVDPSRFVTEQIFTTSKDGTRIPVFLVHGRGQKPDKETPALLTGYGGFLISERPRFQPGIFPWLERGGVFALAVLRGGGEYGEEWHRAGMLTRKQNVFDDFIAAAEKLVLDGWTSPAEAHHPRRIERRASRRRGRSAAARPVRSRAVRRAARRHGPLPPVRLGEDLDQRVRVRRRPLAVQGDSRVLADAAREEGRALSRDAAPLRRRRRPRRSDARAEVRGGVAGGVDGWTRAPAYRAALRPRRRRPHQDDHRADGGRVCFRAPRDGIFAGAAYRASALERISLPRPTGDGRGDEMRSIPASLRAYARAARCGGPPSAAGNGREGGACLAGR
jgi:prolyl oligopeptidase